MSGTLYATTLPPDLGWWVALTVLLTFGGKCLWGGLCGAYQLLREWDDLRKKAKLVDDLEDRIEALEEARCKSQPPGGS